MKVCLLGRYFDLRGAGLGRVSMEVRNGLVKKGYSVHTISTNRSSLYSYFSYTLLGIPIKLRKAEYEVYHALTPMEAIWLPKAKSVVTFHDLFQITDPSRVGGGIGYSGWKNLVGRKYFRFAVNIAKKCNKVVAVSEKTKGDLVECLGIPEEEITVIKSGIRNDLKPIRKGDEELRVGYLGQLDRRKRVGLLIEAFKKSSLDELVIGGVGLDESILKKKAEGDSRIKFLGLIPDNSLVDFYNSLDVFVFPTAIEGYGLPPIEAMACRKPTVVLSDAIIPWEIKSRCIIVENLEVLLGNLQYLRNRMAYIDYDSNYAFAKEHSWDKCIEAYIKVYEEVLNGG